MPSLGTRVSGHDAAAVSAVCMHGVRNAAFRALNTYTTTDINISRRGGLNVIRPRPSVPR